MVNSNRQQSGLWAIDVEPQTLFMVILVPDTITLHFPPGVQLKRRNPVYSTLLDTIQDHLVRTALPRPGQVDQGLVFDLPQTAKLGALRDKCMLAWSKALLLTNRCCRTPYSPAWHDLGHIRSNSIEAGSKCWSAFLRPDWCLTEPVQARCTHESMNAPLPRKLCT